MSYCKFFVKKLKKHTYTNPHPGQYLMHALSHITQAVFTLMGAHHYGITIGSMNRENLCLKDPLLPKVVQSIPLSASSTYHVGPVG